jgi:cytochrome b involved in lipid metabolism
MSNKNIIVGLLTVVLLIGGAFAIFAPESTPVNNPSPVASQDDDVVVSQNEEASTTVVEDTTASSTVVVEEESTPIVVKPVAPQVAPVTPAPPVVVAPAEPEPVVVQPSGITMAEVRVHADEASCWSVVNGVVYDLTTYIPKHPGGKGEILSICGEDGSRAFDGQHGGESKPERILATYRIDDLSN